MSVENYSFCKDKLLCGKELVRYFNRNDAVPPSGGGMKDFAPEGSWMEAKRLEAARREVRDTLKEEHVTSQHSLSSGIWKPDIKEVQMTKTTGRHWLHVGHSEAGQAFLYPEEALFLMDMGQLEVMHGGMPLSFQEAYITLLGSPLSADHYHVYTHLARQGYIVRRHTTISDITSYERRLRLDQHCKKAGKKKRRERPRKRAHPGSSGGADSSKRPCADGTAVVEEPVADDFGGFGYGNISSWTERLADERGEEPTEDALRLPFSDWDWSLLSFPDCSAGTSLELPRPDSSLLPPGVILTEPSYSVPSDCLRLNVKPVRYEDHLEYSHGSVGSKAVLASRNWGEYKARYAALAAGDWRHLAPTAHLWKDDVTPLVSPEDALSSASVLEKLQVIQHLPSSDKSDIFDDADSCPEVFYDVYLPSSKFKKSYPGLPHQRIVVNDPGAGPPDLRDFLRLESYSGDEVPLLWAVLEGAAVAFYAYSSVCLPVDYTVG